MFRKNHHIFGIQFYLGLLIFYNFEYKNMYYCKFLYILLIYLFLLYFIDSTTFLPVVFLFSNSSNKLLSLNSFPVIKFINALLFKFIFSSSLHISLNMLCNTFI